MKNILSSIFILLISSEVIGQIQFEDASYRLPQSGSFYSWFQKGATDMDGDGLDDIVRATPTGDFSMLLQPESASANFTEVSIGKHADAPPLSIILGDLNGDQYPDILTGGSYTGVKVLLSNGGNTYTAHLLPESMDVFTQASAMSDIDGDGRLDLFVCHDDGTNAIWRNQGGGEFTRSNLGVDLNTIPVSDNSGNYGVVFSDFDTDGDIDFYISKCRAGVNDPTDPRRINQLFVNDGNGQYTERAAEFGLADGRQSWVSDFQDIDNDGDFDVLIINHYEASRLLRNDGNGVYTDITLSSGVNIPDGIFQVLMRDFDSDGFIDILVAGNNAQLMHNNGDNTFSTVSAPFLAHEGDPLRSFVSGDFNNDGLVDLYCSYHFNQGAPDKLWLNTSGGDNGFLSVFLSGRRNNFNVVGTRITVHAGDKKYMREIRAGESYGISNSLCQLIGLGSESTLDHLEVIWPDGRKSTFDNIAPNRPIFILQGN